MRDAAVLEQIHCVQGLLEEGKLTAPRWLTAWERQVLDSLLEALIRAYILERGAAEEAVACTMGK